MAEASSSTLGDDVKFVSEVPDMYECPICMSVMKVPVQTECGHRFCKQCIEKSLENKSVCPLDNLYMDRSNIFVDKFAAREINAFEVHCTIPHCTWIGPYGQLENHKKDCDYLIVTCPNKCGDTSLKKVDVENHLLSACKKRIVTCEYCRLKVVFKTLKKHEETCDYYPTECPNECGRKIPFKDLRKHYEEECLKSEGTACSYKKIGCIFQGSEEEVREHKAGSTLEHMQLMAERMTMLEEQRPPACNAVASTYMERSSPSEAVCNDSKESSTTVSELEEMFQVHEQSLEKLGQLAETNRTHQTNLGQQMMSIKQNVENSLKQLKDVLQKQNDFQLELNARMWAGQKFYWRIKNFKDTFKKAKDGHQPALHSTPFYTGIPGYRMCLRINMNGIDSGARSHVSVFVHLMKGEYDSILSWPFLGQIKLSICDQTNRNPCDVIEQLNASRSLQAFEKPQQARNPKGYGYVEMMRHELLNTRNYTRDDTLLLKAEVFLNSTL